jgi:hypothetical protein
MEGCMIEKWRVADDQIPLFVGGDRREIVGMVDCDPVGQSVIRDRATARRHRHRVDVCEAKCLTEPLTEHREADKGRPGAPFEYPRLPRHTAVPQKRDHLLAEGAAAAIERVLVMDTDAAIGRDAPRLETAMQPALEAPSGT